jgi:hypothetical protein
MHNTFVLHLTNSKMKKLKLFVLLGTVLLAGNVFGQAPNKPAPPSTKSETNFSVERNIRLENDSKVDEVLINIKPKTQKLDLAISSSVKKGKITIEIYDPSGVRQGNFTVETQIGTAKEEVVNGNIRKSLFEPEAGNWKVKITPANADVKIRIQTSVVE